VSTLGAARVLESGARGAISFVSDRVDDAGASEESAGETSSSRSNSDTDERKYVRVRVCVRERGQAVKKRELNFFSKKAVKKQTKLLDEQHCGSS
jgi:hypothetical protein